VASRESIRLVLLIAALNELDVLAYDIQNAYINALTKEKAWFVAGPKLGSDCGKKVIIVRALYGMAGSSQAWRSTLASTLREFGFTSCKADPDVWFRAAEKADGTPIYEYVLCYVDDICMAGLDPGEFMKKLGGVYVIKDGSIESPKSYLGADIREIPIDGGTRHAWGMLSKTYLQRAVADVETELAKRGKALFKSSKTPLSPGYRPELDSTPYLRR